MAPFTQLTEGCLEKIIQGAEINKPILQILGAKRINPGADAAERYRLLVSDGKFQVSFAMLATQMNSLYDAGKLVENTIVQIDRYITSLVNRNEKGEKRVLIILELTALHNGAEVGHKLGSPVTIDSASTTTQTTNQQAPGISNGSSYGNTTANVPKAGASTNNNTTISDDLSNSLTHPISSLTPYQNKWVIRARVINKSQIRTWSNAKGEGKLFSMDFMDESGEIRATAFREMVDKYYDMIQIDKVYYVSRCLLKVANKQYSTIKNDYEMTFSSDTVLQECNDTGKMPEIQYNFVPIANIASMEPNSVVDIMGICKEATDVQTFTAKSSGRELKKREVTLLDRSGSSISLTLWGAEAENFNPVEQPVICLKGTRITEFGGGKSLSIVGGTTMKLNPDVPEGHKLRGWFDNGGADQNVTSLSTRNANNMNFNTEWLTFEEVKARNLGSGDNADYFMLKGIIHFVKNQNAFYKACPQADCNKKVIDQENGMFRCEKCNADFNEFKYRLLLNFCIADTTSNHWVTCFNELGEQLMEMTAQEIGRRVDEDKEDIATVFSKCQFKQFIFKLRTKVEYYGDSTRSKMVAIAANPIDHKEYQNYLIKQITELTGVKPNIPATE